MKFTIFKKAIFSLLLTVCLSPFVHADRLQYGYVEFLDTQNLQIQVSDQGFYLSRFSIIQEYGNENQRLPLTSIRTGSIVALEVEYSEARNGFVINKLIIMPNEQVLNELIQSTKED